jgi:hypothetical protein
MIVIETLDDMIREKVFIVPVLVRPGLIFEYNEILVRDGFFGDNMRGCRSQERSSF